MSHVNHFGLTKIFDGTYDISASTVAVMLVTSSYVADADHQYASTPAAYELSGTGYTRKTLSSKTVSVDDTNNRCVIDAGDVTWTGIDAGSAAGVVGFISTGNDATSPLLFYINDGGLPVTTNGGDLIVQWNASGIFYV